MQYLNGLRYSFHVIFHPFDGFWDLKREKKGNLKAAITFVILIILTYTIQKQNTAFLFNFNRLEELNVIVDIITVLLVYILWCVSSWCLTSLMDGEGTLKDIAIATAYALVPIVLINLPLVPISYTITADEGAFYHTFQTFSYIWAGGLLLFSTMITHQYSMKKTMLTVICTIAGMGIILFIGLLFFSVIQQILNFAITMYKELRFRM
jgi:hypothetical protein